MSWKTLLTEDLKEWLLAGEPWIVYRTLTDLMDTDETGKAVVTAKMAIPEHLAIKKIFKDLNKDGYWKKSQVVPWQRCLCLGHLLKIPSFKTVKSPRELIFSLNVGRIEEK